VNVQKFGGTSVGSIERIQHVATLVKESLVEDPQTCVVVSAMSGETDRLVSLYRQISPDIHTTEYDLLVASGEQAAASLLSAALNRVGVRAVPLLGFQAGFETDAKRGRARITQINEDLVLDYVKQGIVPVVTGFQGADAQGRITTLGRGGSDTSAVALAAAVKASVCKIYTDVSGVFTTDPRICPDARHIPRLSFEEMMELASLGAKVMHPRAIEIGAKFGIPIQVLNTFQKGNGTMIGSTHKDGDSFESPVVSAVTYDHNMILVSVKNVKSGVDALNEIFGKLSTHGVILDIIVHSAPRADGCFDLSFSAQREDALVVEQKLGGLQPEIQTGFSKVSIVGTGMASHSGVAARMFRVLSSAKVPVVCTTTSEIKVSCVIPSTQVEASVRGLHAEFNLAGA
jgi:aspartate kinase